MQKNSHSDDFWSPHFYTVNGLIFHERVDLWFD